VDKAEDFEPGVSVFVFSTDIFSLNVIKRAAYRFTNRFSFEFTIDGNAINCIAAPLEPLLREDLLKFEAGFRNEVLDQDLRQRISEETAPIRNTILAYAFSRTELQSVD
jgi:His-Xaa-Ser system protein HxsD